MQECSRFVSPLVTLPAYKLSKADNVTSGVCYLLDGMVYVSSSSMISA